MKLYEVRTSCSVRARDEDEAIRIARDTALFAEILVTEIEDEEDDE